MTTTEEFFNATKKIGEMLVEKDLDYLMIVTGRERIGKSSLAMQVALSVDPEFDVSQIVFDVPNLYEQVYKLKKGQAVIIDEGATAFFAREAMNTDVREGIKLLTVMGERNLFVGIGVSLALCGAYFGVDTICRDLGSRAALPPTVAAWLPIVIFVSIAITLHDAFRN